MSSELSARELQSRGGKARARNLTPERRREIAAMGGKTRGANAKKRQKDKKGPYKKEGR